jgi:hypothetical protein
MLLGPAVSGTPTSSALMTATVNSVNTGAAHAQITLEYEMANQTAGRSGQYSWSDQLYDPTHPGDGPSTTTQEFTVGGSLLIAVTVQFGTINAPLTQASTLDLTLTVNDGFGNTNTYPVLLSGGASGEYLTGDYAQDVAIWLDSNTDPFFYGWDTSAAFAPPWSLTGLTFTNGDANETGTVIVDGTRGETDLNVTLDASGAAVLAVSPPVLMDQNSTVTVNLGSIFENLTMSATITGLGTIAPGTIPADGAPAGDGTNPQIVLQVSNDGGKTWSRERPAAMGKIGEYRRLVRWRQNGRSNNRCFRVICSEPVDVALIAADLDAATGS